MKESLKKKRTNDRAPTMINGLSNEKIHLVISDGAPKRYKEKHITANIDIDNK